ncbi:hypothetical protein TthSNM11_03620 [Thermus thermophilus]|nr:hypothetical protein TthSNM11_03620 [Thermus thermophilus]
MIRPVARKDLPGLLRLLRHMDQSPERGVLAPEARDLEGLAEELEDGLVLLKGEEVAGYVGLYPFWDGAALEGPLAYREEDLPPSWRRRRSGPERWRWSGFTPSPGRKTGSCAGFWRKRASVSST